MKTNYLQNARITCIILALTILANNAYAQTVSNATPNQTCDQKITNEENQIPQSVYEKIIPRALTSFEFRQATYGYQLSFAYMLPVWKVNHDNCEASLQRLVVSCTLYSTTPQALVLSYSSPISEVKGQILVTIEPTTGKILNMTSNLPSLPLISTITLGPTGSNCAQKISDEESKRSDLIYYQKAPFTISTSKEFRSKTQGYQASWSGLYPVWDADTKMCTLSLKGVKVVYTLHGSMDSQQDLVLFVDPTMNVIVNMTNNISIPPLRNVVTMSPLRQLQAGIAANNVVCKEGLQLVIKAENDSPVCVTPLTYNKLVLQGWAKVMTSSTEKNGTLSGNVVLAGGPLGIGTQKNYEVDVYATDGVTIVAKTLIDANAHYSIQLPAGNYIIYAPDYPTKQTHFVSVFSGKNTILNIGYGAHYK